MIERTCSDTVRKLRFVWATHDQLNENYVCGKRRESTHHLYDGSSRSSSGGDGRKFGQSTTSPELNGAVGTAHA